MVVELDIVEETAGDDSRMFGSIVPLPGEEGSVEKLWNDRWNIRVDEDGMIDARFWVEGETSVGTPCWPTRYDLVGRKRKVGSHYRKVVLTCGENLEVPGVTPDEHGYRIEVDVDEDGTTLKLDRPLSTPVWFTQDPSDPDVVSIWFDEPGSLAPLEPVYDDYDFEEEGPPIVEAVPTYYYHETLDPRSVEQKVIWRVVLRTSWIDSAEFVKGLHKGSTSIFVPHDEPAEEPEEESEADEYGYEDEEEYEDEPEDADVEE
jgi:hypothetical protein